MDPLSQNLHRNFSQPKVTFEHMIWITGHNGFNIIWVSFSRDAYHPRSKLMARVRKCHHHHQNGLFLPLLHLLPELKSTILSISDLPILFVYKHLKVPPSFPRQIRMTSVNYGIMQNKGDGGLEATTANQRYVSCICLGICSTRSTCCTCRPQSSQANGPLLSFIFISQSFIFLSQSFIL